jgi:molybdopterin/thiamine biosynthesis adenylyltransferase
VTKLLEAACRNLMELNPTGNYYPLQTEDWHVNLNDFDLFISVGSLSFQAIEEMDVKCQSANCRFIHCQVVGFYGLIFLDLLDFPFKNDKEKKIISYPPFSKLRNIDLSLMNPRKLKDATAALAFLLFLQPDLSIDLKVLDEAATAAIERVRRNLEEFKLSVYAVSCIIGGMCSQEAIKILTATNLPIKNLFVFEGLAGTGVAVQLE